MDSKSIVEEHLVQNQDEDYEYIEGEEEGDLKDR